MATQSPKTILLMRHAKSSWDHSGLRDFDRPLNNRGLKDAPRMGRYLKEISIIPDQIFSSPAARAKATTKAVVKELDQNAKIISWDEDLYFNGPAAYADAIRRADDQSTVVMTVGHNPMTEEILKLLANRPVNEHIATATITCLEISSSSWKEIKYGQCEIKWIMRPKDLSLF